MIKKRRSLYMRLGSTWILLVRQLRNSYDFPSNKNYDFKFQSLQGTKFLALDYAHKYNLKLVLIHLLQKIFIIPIEGFDIVLGIQWPQILGPILWDFTSLTMRFEMENTNITLHKQSSNNLLQIQAINNVHLDLEPSLPFLPTYSEI